MKTKLEVCKEVVPELDRFSKKLKEAIKELQTDEVGGCYQHHKYSAAKRAALDLKKELTKLTQDSKYRYQ